MMSRSSRTLHRAEGLSMPGGALLWCLMLLTELPTRVITEYPDQDSYRAQEIRNYVDAHSSLLLLIDISGHLGVLGISVLGKSGFTRPLIFQFQFPVLMHCTEIVQCLSGVYPRVQNGLHP